MADPCERSASRGRARKLFSLDDEEGEGGRERGTSGGEKGSVQKEAVPGAQIAEQRVWRGKALAHERRNEQESERGWVRERRAGASDTLIRCRTGAAGCESTVENV